MAEFDQATAVARTGDGTYRAVVPESWQQGRGAFGGLVLGTLLRAMQADETAGRPVRIVAGDICGPVVPGEAAVRVEQLRRGRSQSNLRADLVQQGQVQATAMAVLSDARPSEVTIVPAAPAERDWRDVPVLPLAAPAAAEFTAHYEYRPIGALPLASGPEAVAEGFIRERDLLPRLDAPALVGRIDAFWPTLWAMTDRMRPMATISFVAELFAEPSALDPATPLRYRARAVHVGQGFLFETRELWSGSTPVAMNQQTFAIIG